MTTAKDVKEFRSERQFAATRMFPFAAGLWLVMVFTKFGTPVIFEDQITTPTNALQFVMDPWPFGWGYLLLGVVFLLALPVWRWTPAAPKWILIVPLVWFGWQVVSAAQTVDRTLTQRTVLDFAACVICFYVGLFALGRSTNNAPLWSGLGLGLLCALWVGLGQHFGGLEETRRMAEHIQWELYPPEFKAAFQQKMASERIFGTFFYPNALAGGIILAFPPSLVALWKWCARFPFIIRGVLTGTFVYVNLACLFWSGSKAGWLIMLAIGLATLAHVQQITARQKVFAIIILMAAGAAAFVIKNSAYFAKKTNSATARMEYWKAAGQMLWQKPLLGWGPGTFKIGYQRLKRPEAEPTKLAHNDYLQQGSDSGLIGMCSYAVLVVGSVICLYGRMRQRMRDRSLRSGGSSAVAQVSKPAVSPTSKSAGRRKALRAPTRAASAGLETCDTAGSETCATPRSRASVVADEDCIPLAVWLGVAGLAAQEFVEFSLYIPSLAWPFFLFVGWLWGVTGRQSGHSVAA